MDKLHTAITMGLWFAYAFVTAGAFKLYGWPALFVLCGVLAVMHIWHRIRHGYWL